MRHADILTYMQPNNGKTVNRHFILFAKNVRLRNSAIHLTFIACVFPITIANFTG